METCDAASVPEYFNNRHNISGIGSTLVYSNGSLDGATICNFVHTGLDTVAYLLLSYGKLGSDSYFLVMQNSLGPYHDNKVRPSSVN